MFSASSAVKIQVDLCLWSAKSKEFGEILGQFSPAVAVGPRCESWSNSRRMNNHLDCTPKPFRIHTYERRVASLVE